jgi:hypothetical protein
MPLYYRSGVWFQPGETVPKANWGRVIQTFGKTHNLFYREMLYELVRAQHFADRPSRMACVFAFESENVARGFNQPNAPLLYRVSLSNPNALAFRADMSWIDAIARGPNAFAEAESHARQYWQGDQRAGHWEIVADCVLTVEALLA